MPKIIIDGRTIECRDNIPVLQAALEAGLEVPHYCYHPALTIVASCRLCLMEMKMPHPQTKEMVWAPKLVPSCQTPVKDGLEVRFDSEAVRSNQRHVLEYYLLNHPLDCPVCDKAGECWLQDYSEEFGHGSSRMIDEKYKNPKKDIGPHTLLYQDRCVLCSRCVRFTDEIAGTGELKVVSRGSRCEIDVFPGLPLDNPLQGNVVDLCPVGALLDKDFLFRQRVWLLRSARSLSPVDSGGQAIWIDYNQQGIHRIRPRFNPAANGYWISDEARFGWKFVHRTDRLLQPRARAALAAGLTGGDGRRVMPAADPRPVISPVFASGGAVPEIAGAPPVVAEPRLSGDDSAALAPVRWEDLPGLLREQFAALAGTDGGSALAAVLSPMMSCEEAWLLAAFIRGLAPQATLVTGFVPIVGEDQVFPEPARSGSRPGSAAFTIRAEKCPNRRGVELIAARFGGPRLSFADFLAAAGAGRLRAAYLAGGYPREWVAEGWVRPLVRIAFLVLHDLFASPLQPHAAVQIPGASWAEREGSFMNWDGLLQPFERAILPPAGVKPDGQFLYELAGYRGLFRAAQVRQLMAERIPEMANLYVPPDAPRHAH